jgi:Protein of unknown function (DUF2852)
MAHTASATRSSPRGRWSALNIVLMVIGFALFWPLGLAMLAWIIWGEEIAAKAEDMKAQFRGFSGRARGFAGDSFRAGGRTGNAAFDEYRTQELRRLDEERRKLEKMRGEFESFLAELRRVKDQEEFDRFMRAFRNRTDSGSATSA